MRHRGLTGAALIVLAAGGAAAETRCGWIDNPTPANWWLTDAAGEWTIAVQGGHQAGGMDRIPDLTAGDWVATNGSYGYGCTCMDVAADPGQARIVAIFDVRPLPMSRCTGDPALSPRKGP
jgi:hypothetical protein